MVNPINKIISKIREHGHDPSYILSVLIALARGTYYAAYYRMFRRNVRIRLPFKAFAKVSIIGNGSVLIDRNCAAGLSVFKGLTIHMLSENAEVKIGANCNLEGLTIRCSSRVEVGRGTITATSIIQDCLLVNRGNSLDGKCIKVGENVWLGGNTIILSGSVIGNDSVVAAGALCKDIELSDYSLASGNPVKRGLPIANLLKFKGAA